MWGYLINCVNACNNMTLEELALINHTTYTTYDPY